MGKGVRLLFNQRTIVTYGWMLASSLKMTADDFYDETYQPCDDALTGMAFSPIDKICKPLVDPAHFKKTTDWLAACGITELSAYRKGSTASVFVGQTGRGHKYAVRFPVRFGNGLHERTVHEGVMQPLQRLPYKEGSSVEILPLMPFMPVRRIGGLPTFASLPRRCAIFLVQMFRAAGLESARRDMFEKGIAVLPDGTPLFGGPDEARLSPVSLPTQERLAKLYEEHSFMKAIKGTDEAGKPKQGGFFPPLNLPSP